MTTKTKRITIASLAVAGLLTLGAAVAAPHMAEHGFGGGFGPHGFGPRLHRFLADLDLSETQKGALKTVLSEEHPKIEPLLDRKIETHKALFEVVHADAFDENAVRAAARKAAEADVDLAVEKAVLFSRVRGVLTEAQRAQVDEALEHLVEKVGRRIDLGRTIWREHAGDFIDAL